MTSREGTTKETAIHTMQDDLASARPTVSIGKTKNSPARPINQPKPFPVPARPTGGPAQLHNGNLVLPHRSSILTGRRKPIQWFIIGAVILIILNIIIWGIAIVG